MRIAMIPARGGSKRIAHKNIKDFCGQPIINYSIKAALESGLFDHVICSTDSQDIAEVAKAAGAEIPFMRPANIADDYATTMDVIAHSLKYYEDMGQAVESLCCIYATAPFVTADDLRKGYDIYSQTGAQFVFSATSYAFPVQRAFYLDDEGKPHAFSPGDLNRRSQDLTEAFHDAGQFYWCRPEAVMAGLPIFAPHSRPVLMPRKRVQDIDTPEDWEFAQALYKIQNERA